MASLSKLPRDERGKAEAETRAKVDGRKLRRKGRTEPIFMRTFPWRRQQLERLAQVLNKDFGETMEEALDALEAKVKGQR